MNKVMKAIVYEKYGSPEVLRLQEVEKPSPKAGEVLVKVLFSSVNYGDLLARNFGRIRARDFNMPGLFLLLAKVYFGFRKPKVKILGSEFSGKVEALGEGVQGFKIGDTVFGYLGQSLGAYGEYIRVSEKSAVALKPDNMDFDEAATIPYGAIMAMNILSYAKIHQGQKILINGASGGIGSIAIQLAKFYDAEVTAVCSTSRIDYVKALGADKVFDYTKDDFTQMNETYDVILDILGRCSFSKCKDSLKPQGVYLLASFKMKQVFQMIWTSIFKGKRVICGLVNEKPGDMVRIKKMVEDGAIRSILDKTYPMAQAAEAHEYAEQGKKTGNIVIAISEYKKLEVAGLTNI